MSAPAGDPNLDATLVAFQDLSYRDAFWPVRVYEDRCDRVALRAFMPPAGERLLEVGAGFGRLADEYGGYRQVVLLDPSGPLLSAARERLAHDARYEIVTGDAFRLPFADASFDTVVCIRVVHHFADPRLAIREFARVLRPGGVLVLESSNKRNLKAIAAYLLRRQSWSPFERGSHDDGGVYLLPGALRRSGSPGSAAEPVWTSPATAYDHAPADLRSWLRAAGLRVDATRTVSIFRLPALSRHVPPELLVTLERPLQSLLASVTPGPSLYFRSTRRVTATGTRLG